MYVYKHTYTHCLLRLRWSSHATMRASCSPSSCPIIIHTYMHTYMHTYVQSIEYVCVYIYIYICVCVCTKWHSPKRTLIFIVSPSSHTEANQIAGFRQSLHQASLFQERKIPGPVM